MLYWRATYEIPVGRQSCRDGFNEPLAEFRIVALGYDAFPLHQKLDLAGILLKSKVRTHFLVFNDHLIL